MTVVERINQALRPVSMYKGILFGLLSIWLLAVVLASFEVLSVSPLALLLSLIVACGATWLSSWLTGLVFGAHTQADSSIITGLILTLIITPNTDVAALSVIGFAGLIAGASKYVVAWRGRHIFNPAALAAVIISLTGLGAVSWWVATPVLTPLVALVACVALYQTRRFDAAGLFLAVSVPLVLIQLLGYGASLGESLLLLLSWPLLFIVGVMLIEPLTLPPRKWQIYLVTVVIALLVALPFSIGPLHMSPAFAIVLGNLLAAILAGRSALYLTFTKREQLTPTSYEYFFEPSKPLTHTAGQYIEISLPHKHADLRGERRSFSVTSKPGSDETTLGIKFYQPSSSFKQAVSTLQKGERISVTQCAGDFVLPKNAATPLLFIAGGIGITPFISQLRELQHTHQDRNIVIVYAISSAEEFAYATVLSKKELRGIVVSPARPTAMPSHWNHLQASRIDFNDIAELIPDHSERDVYISGPTPFVHDAKVQLRKIGARRIVTDYFSGY